MATGGILAEEVRLGPGSGCFFFSFVETAVNQTVKDEVFLSSCREVALPPQCGLTMELKRRLCMPAPVQRRRGLRALLADCALYRRGSFLPLTS